MDWSNERYVRIYVRNTVKLSVLTWEARAILWEIIRTIDRAGVMDLDGHEPHVAVSAVTGIDEDVVEAHLPRLLKGRKPIVVIESGKLCVPSHMSAQEAVASSAQRKRDERSRRRALCVTQRDLSSRNVKDRDGVSRNVTESHVQSRAVTFSHSVLNLTEPSCTESNNSYTDVQLPERATKVVIEQAPSTPIDQISVGQSRLSGALTEISYIAPKGHKPLAPMGRVKDKLAELLDVWSVDDVVNGVRRLAAALDDGVKVDWPADPKTPWSPSYVFSGYWQSIQDALDSLGDRGKPKTLVDGQALATHERKVYEKEGLEGLRRYRKRLETQYGPEETR